MTKDRRQHHWMRSRLFLLVFMTLTAEKCQGEMVVYNHLRNRGDALEFCLQEGYTGLVVLDTPEKMELVAGLALFGQHDEQYWVGLAQNNTNNPQTTTYTWDDPSATSWVQWRLGQPDNLPFEFCARLWYGDIFNSRCELLFYFICQTTYEESPLTTTEISATTATPTPSDSTPNRDDETATIRHGYYPIIHKDTSLQNPRQDLVLVSGKTRSEIECLTLCAQEEQCKYTVFTKEAWECTAYATALREHMRDGNELVSHLGTNIRKKNRRGENH